jgi:hypothetical protein
MTEIPLGSASRRQVIESENFSLMGQSRLSWSRIEGENIILSGDTDANSLRSIRNTVVLMRR